MGVHASRPIERENREAFLGCLTVVGEGSVAVVESFGKFSRFLGPGVKLLNPFGVWHAPPATPRARLRPLGRASLLVPPAPASPPALLSPWPRRVSPSGRSAQDGPFSPTPQGPHFQQLRVLGRGGGRQNRARAVCRRSGVGLTLDPPPPPPPSPLAAWLQLRASRA